MSQSTGLSLYFISILIPDPPAKRIVDVKEEILNMLGYNASLNAPPHITLVPPFRATARKIEEILPRLVRTADGIGPFSLHTGMADRFGKRVAFLSVKESAALKALYESLAQEFGPEKWVPDRTFAPHITLIHRIKSQDDFQTAWEIAGKWEAEMEFLVQDLSLLKHDGRRWQVQRDFSFGNSL